MKPSEVEKEKRKIIKWVTNLKDSVVLEKLHLLRTKPKAKDWWDEISEEEKVAIERGLTDIRRGKITPHKEVKKLLSLKS
jgi:hypothetical protein